MPHENITLSWEELKQELQTPSQWDNCEIKNYLDGICPDATLELQWPAFEEQVIPPDSHLTEDARHGVKGAIARSVTYIDSIYKRASANHLISKKGKEQLENILKASNYNDKKYHVQQLVKDILSNVHNQMKGKKFSYEETIELWKSEYPSLEELKLPCTQDLLLPLSVSEDIAKATLHEATISTENEFKDSFHSSLNKQLMNGPQNMLNNAIAKLESI